MNELWKYKSNPTFKDTDFDGLVDTGTTDPMKKSGEITGTINYINNAGSEAIKDTMDYRYFYLNNKMYYDELARMSLIMSNAVTKGTGGTNYDMNHIDSAMRGIGMTAEYSNVSSGSYQVSIAIGHREIEYDNIKKNVILISVSAARDLTEYQGFSKVGNSNWTNDSNYNANHYEAYERLSKVVYDKLKNYITSHSLSENTTYWVTGYGTGGGVANLLSARIIDMPPVSTSVLKVSNAVIFGYGSTTIGRMVDTGNTNIYTYTFGAPNVVYFDNQPELINANKYKSIFNVVDMNDVFAHLPSTKSGWGKYGWNMSPSGNYDKCKDIIDTYSRVFDNIDNKRDVIAITSLDDNVLFYLYTAWGYNELTNNTTYFNGMQNNQVSKYRTFYNKYYVHYKDLEPKHSIKNYYSLCKKILPEHMTIGDGWVDVKASSNYISMPQALETMGKWYCNNVYTYDPYSSTDFERDGIIRTFSGRFQYDYDRASSNAKKDRELKVNRYNNEHTDEKYLIASFSNVSDYKLDLETFIGNRGDHALYACDNLNDSCYAKYKNVADDCSAFTLAVMYYATKGAMDEYDSLDIYELGGGTLYSVETGIDIYDDLKTVGYEKIPVKNGTYDELESGDILVASNHYEFYYVDSNGKRTSFGWGSVKDKFPNKNCSIIENPTNKVFSHRGSDAIIYKYIYRLTKGVAYER